jgi:hypothetical protein
MQVSIFPVGGHGNAPCRKAVLFVKHQTHGPRTSLMGNVSGAQPPLTHKLFSLGPKERLLARTTNWSCRSAGPPPLPSEYGTYIQDSQGRILALAFRYKSLNLFKLCLVRSEAELGARAVLMLSGPSAYANTYNL